MNVEFGFPEGEEDYEGIFTLVMGYDTDSENEVDIYYYNEGKGLWESQEGEVDKESQEISLKVSHFSNYGVFSEVDESGKEEDPPVPETPTDDSDEDKNDDEGRVIIEDEENQVIKENGILPSTASNHYNMILIGILLISFATVICYMQRKRQATK